MKEELKEKIEKSHNTLQISQNSGITLIALIITIIVLLILAVVAIRAVTGDGIIQHATDAKQKYNSSQEEEKIQLALNEWKISSNLPDNNKTLSDFLREKLADVELIENATDKSITITTQSLNKYKVTQDEKLIKLIKFTVNDVEFYAEQGMTWKEFASSKYNNHKIDDQNRYYISLAEEESKIALLKEYKANQYAGMTSIVGRAEVNLTEKIVESLKIVVIDDIVGDD